MLSQSIMYADDTTFLCKHEDLNLLNEFSNLTCMAASEWFNANAFLLNEQKTKHMIFSNKKGCKDLNFMEPVRFLGVVLDCNLTWTKHVDHISSKLSRVLFLLRNLNNFITPSYARCAYFSFFQSVFRYGLIFGGNCSRASDILILQKKAIRILSHAGFLDHCRPLFIKLEILTVINLYIFDVLVYTLNRLDNYNLVSSTHGHKTRHNDNIMIPYFRLNSTHNSYKVIGMKIYNKIPKRYYDLPVERLKHRFYLWLLCNPFYSLDEFFNKPDSDILF